MILRRWKFGFESCNRRLSLRSSLVLLQSIKISLMLYIPKKMGSANVRAAYFFESVFRTESRA